MKAKAMLIGCVGAVCAVLIVVMGNCVPKIISKINEMN